MCDVESKKWIEFLMIGVYGPTVRSKHTEGFEYQYFTELGSFFSYIFNNYAGMDIFAHFGGRFDFLFIIKEILMQNAGVSENERIHITEMVPRGSGILYIVLRRGSKIITLRDSSALLPFGLARITRNFGVHHQKQEFDFSKLKRVTKKLVRYNKYDCIGLYESLEKFFDWPIIRKAGPAYTIASQSIRVLRTYLDESIYCLNKNLDEKIRTAYFGGRVEIFRPFFKGTRDKQLYNYDVNSLYPTVMLQNDFPNAFLYETDEYEANELGFYECEFNVPSEMYCPPIGIVRDGKYCFPTGIFKAFCTTHEINYARSIGIKCRTSNGFIFSNGGRIFEKYVKDLYQIRKRSEKDSVDDTIAKLLMNSCYGRFGLRLERENIVFDDGSPGLKHLRNLVVGDRTYRLMTKEVELESFNNVAIAAFVTAYARIHMHKIYRECGRELFYTDTDSIFTTKKFDESRELGGLKLVDQVESACFLLPKTYIAGEKIVMKGFDKKKIQHFTIEDFYTCLEGDLKRLKISEEPKFATLKTALRNNKILTLTKGSTRQIRSMYDKRVIYKNANGDYESRPIHIEKTNLPKLGRQLQRG